jgi:hypothetical protein
MKNLPLIAVIAWLLCPETKDVVESIERVKLHDGRNGSPTWFIAASLDDPGEDWCEGADSPDIISASRCRSPDMSFKAFRHVRGIYPVRHAIEEP